MNIAEKMVWMSPEVSLPSPSKAKFKAYNPIFQYFLPFSVSCLISKLLNLILRADPLLFNWIPLCTTSNELLTDIIPGQTFNIFSF